MIATTSRPLMFSILLHAFVIVVALLLFLPANREQVAVSQSFIFTSAAPSQSSAPAKPATSAATVKFPVVKVPVVRPAAPVADERMDAPVRPRASFVPASHTTVAEVKRPHAISPAHSTSGPQVARAPARIDVNAVLASADDALSSVASSSLDESLAADYVARLQAKLRAAHEKPAGLDAGLRVSVEFLLRADGSLGNVRILRTSGSDAFDASVLAAFARLRDLGVPPVGVAGVKSVTFRTSDGV